MRIPSAVVGTAIAACFAMSACDGIADGGKRARLPLVLALQLGDGHVAWVLDSLTVTVEAGGERHEARRPVDAGEGMWEFDFDVPDEPLDITASVTSARRSSEVGPGRIELMRAVYQGPARDVIDLTLEAVAPILALEMERDRVSPDEPARFLVHNLGVGELAWNVVEVVPGNTCFVGNTPLPCLQFHPTGGVLAPNEVEPLDVVLRAGEVRAYGFRIDSPTGDVGSEVTVTAPPRADLEVRLVYRPGVPAAGWEVQVEGPAFRVSVTDSTGTAFFADLPLGEYGVAVPSTGTSRSLLLPVNGVRVILTLTLGDIG